MSLFRNISPARRNFVKKTFALLVPASAIFLTLAGAGLLDALVAFCSWLAMVLLTFFFALPSFFDIRSALEYGKKLTSGAEETPAPSIDYHDKDAQNFLSVINELRNIWMGETRSLKAQTLSDAAVLDSLPDPLIILQASGQIIGANLAARDIFGHNIRGRELGRVLPYAPLNEAFDAMIRSHIAAQTVEFQLSSPWDKTFGVKLSLLPAKGTGDGEVLLAFHDITAHRRMEKSMREFVSHASHELKTPLAVVSGFVETLQTTAKDDPKAQQEFLALIETQARRMSHLVGRLLSLSKIEANVKPVGDAPVPLLPLLQAVTQSLQARAAGKNMTLAVEEASFSPVTAGEEEELYQAFLNLAENAIKYGAAGTAVRISFSPPSDGKGAVHVQNFGPPISRENLAHLFERFYRADNAGHKKEEGTGLGLAIVKSIVSRHHGTIGISSDEENGTVFSVTLPARPAGRDPLENSSSPSASG